jgi:DNA-binding NarL/FixJ family response regulator
MPHQLPSFDDGPSPSDLWFLLSSPPTSPQGQAGIDYLRRCDINGQDWELLFKAVERIPIRAASSDKFRGFIPSVLDVDDVLNEFRLMLYDRWVADYLDHELLKQQKAPRRFSIFLRDRLYDYLKTQYDREINRRRLDEQKASLTRPQNRNGQRSLPTGGKSLLPLTKLSHPEGMTELDELVSMLLPGHLKILPLILNGYSQKEIAELCRISISTVSRRVQEIADYIYADGQEKADYHEGESKVEEAEDKEGGVEDKGDERL